MKKVMIALSVIGFITLTSCTKNNLGEESPYGEEVNQLEGVALELTANTYQPEGDRFELRVRNNSKEQVTYGVAYVLEYYDETTWFEVEPDKELSFITIAHLLDTGDEAVEEVNLDYYEPLDIGHYRIIRQIDGEPLAAEFEVTEN